LNKLRETNEMFYGCENLKSANLSGFYTENVYNMSNMFYGCKSLSSLDIRNFNTKNIMTKESYKDLFKDITNSNSFTLIFNISSTKEISDAINENWNRVIIE
jgi:surface protein